jgi:hypothetical protein
LFDFLFKRESPEAKAKRLEAADNDKKLQNFMKKYTNYLKLTAGEKGDQLYLPAYWDKLELHEKELWLKKMMKREVLLDYINERVEFNERKL